MPNAVVQYTLGQIYDLITPAFEAALAASQDIASNTSRISAAFKAANQMPDGPDKTNALATLNTLSRQQAQIILDHRAFAQRWNAAIKGVNDFAAQQGYVGPEMTLAGYQTLGQMELIVGGSIAAAVIGVVAYVAYEQGRNKVVSGALDPIEQIVNKRLTGQITQADAIALLNSTKAAMSAAADAAEKSNPDSISKMLGSLVLPLALVAAILIVPSLLPKRSAS